MPINGTTALAAGAAAYVASYYLQSNVTSSNNLLSNMAMGAISNISALKVFTVVAVGSTLGSAVLSIVATSVISAIFMFVLSTTCSMTMKVVKFGYSFFVQQNKEPVIEKEFTAGTSYI